MRRLVYSLAFTLLSSSSLYAQEAQVISGQKDTSYVEDFSSSPEAEETTISFAEESETPAQVSTPAPAPVAETEPVAEESPVVPPEPMTSPQPEISSTPPAEENTINFSEEAETPAINEPATPSETQPTEISSPALQPEAPIEEIEENTISFSEEEDGLEPQPDLPPVSAPTLVPQPQPAPLTVAPSPLPAEPIVQEAPVAVHEIAPEPAAPVLETPAVLPLPTPIPLSREAVAPKEIIENPSAEAAIELEERIQEVPMPTPPEVIVPTVQMAPKPQAPIIEEPRAIVQPITPQVEEIAEPSSAEETPASEPTYHQAAEPAPAPTPEPVVTPAPSNAFSLDNKAPLPANLLSNDGFAPALLNKRLSNIPPEQKAQMLMKQKYDEMDANHDGMISEEEFVEYKTEEARKISKEIFKKIDNNKDTQISEYEYSILMKKMIESYIRQPRPRSPREGTAAKMGLGPRI